ncbi:Cannabidiolic acid synthase [Ceratobasidium theobromae]|uniref:Cannabidiolic acid synthase n=1 Tax=Ceratobasidium theobromae TaxID=1582974 RepID=A0A5N5QXH2_9AGAM|nr:Cannabidiolic acid synthase [Ceratobasidium theobromae]
MWTRTTAVMLAGALTLVAGALVDVERRSVFTNCLSNGSSSGQVVTPSSSGYSLSRAAFNQRLSYKPAAIVYPSSPQDVQKYVKCAASSGIAVVGRSGGHSYAAYGVGGQDGVLVIDLKNMNSFSIDGSGVAKIQTGNRLGDVAQKLWDNGQRALPHGTCPYVGSGGHAAFGGYGPFSRVAGLLHDRITEAEVVLANGTLATASSTQNADLFWALRGAGASYAIVTQWTFSTLAAPPTVIGYTIDYSSTLSASKIASLLGAWQSLAMAAPKEMAMICAIGKNDGGGLYLQFTGDYYGTKSAFDSATANWASKLSPGKITPKTYNWYNSLVATDGPLSTTKSEPKDTFFAKSLFTKQTVTASQWTSFVNYLSKQGVASNTDWFVEIDLYGGTIKSQGADSTSFAHRDAIFSFQFYASSSNMKPPYPSNGIPFVNNMLNALDPNPQAAYVNYVDPTLTDSQWKSQYYGSHYSRLSAIKRAVDPNNVFRFPQSIGLS